MRTERVGQSALLFLDVAEILTRENIDYLIIGAFALSIHGLVRASSDVDALLFVSYSRLAELSTIFEAAEFKVAIRRGEDDIAMKCFAGSAQDLTDARAAFEGAQGPVDLDLLRAVTRRFNRAAADRLEELL